MAPRPRPWPPLGGLGLPRRGGVPPLLLLLLVTATPGAWSGTSGTGPPPPPRHADPPVPVAFPAPARQHPVGPVAKSLGPLGVAEAEAQPDQSQLPPMRFPDGPSRETLARAGAGAGNEPPSPPSRAVPRQRTTLSAKAAASASAPANATLTTGTGPSTTSASSERQQPFVEPTKSAGILIGVFVGMALLGYAGLLVWRRVLEKRYGNREILVNEEQFEQERDLGNFQL